MKTESFPLQVMSIRDVFGGQTQAVYEVPIYQRNYAWGIDEITALVQDAYDAWQGGKDAYYIGTLVTYHKGDRVYEVIDGQQRLTTIYLTLVALDETPKNKLTYRARTKSTETIKHINDWGNVLDTDDGIVSGFKFAKNAVGQIVSGNELSGFRQYFMDRVQLVFYQVPKDIDLNHYFEIMNSRGEQLEQHEVVKALLLGKLDREEDRTKLARIWEFCSEMDVYIQQKYSKDKDAAKVFGAELYQFLPDGFDDLPDVKPDDAGEKASISDLLGSGFDDKLTGAGEKSSSRFQPIIDFPNFLLIVLKLTRMSEAGFNPEDFSLDDKELIKEFESWLSNAKLDQSNLVKTFGFNLLRSKYYLDNCIVHHTNEDDKLGDNPWKLQRWEHGTESDYPANLFGHTDQQRKCEQLLSMFEVSFTARQRKNYLFYCLLFLSEHRSDLSGYCGFLSGLAKAYLYDVYLGPDDGLTDKNTPKPRSFDRALLRREVTINGEFYKLKDLSALAPGFLQVVAAESRFGNGVHASRGIPLFVFNYLDYLLWELYNDNIRGRRTKEGDQDRKAFFEALGCSDFGLDLFDDFYFSRTRRSLEHYYSQAQQRRDEESGAGAITTAQINCLGNYAMIGSEANSSGSDWSPIVKLDHYLDASRKVDRVSVASIKFMIMMRICDDNRDSGSGRPQGKEWNYEDIQKHQDAMAEVLLGKRDLLAK